MQLRKATRKKAKIRLGLSAVAGGGKTYSAILIAKGLCGDLSKVAIIDTEHGSADLYAHLGDYNVLPLEAPYPPEKYIEAIQTCEKSGMEVIIIDSITHEWDGKGGCLEIVDQLTKGGSKNSYTAWGNVTPRHQAFIDTILKSPCHIITTVRRKQDYEMNKDSNGKVRVEKAGLKEITREGFEYELTINLQLDQAHLATASKDRTGLFMGKPEFVPSEQTGELIAKWCEEGEDLAEAVKPGSEWYNKVYECNTKKELVALYNNNKLALELNPLLQQLFSKRRDELNAKAAEAPAPVQASAGSSAESKGEDQQDQSQEPADTKQQDPKSDAPATAASEKKEEKPADPKKEKPKGKQGISEKAFNEALLRIENGEGSVVEKLRDTFILTEAQEAKLQEAFADNLPF